MSEVKGILPFQMNFLPEFVLRKVVHELNETPDRRIEGINLLKELLSNNKSKYRTLHDDEEPGSPQSTCQTCLKKIEAETRILELQCNLDHIKRRISLIESDQFMPGHKNPQYQEFKNLEEENSGDLAAAMTHKLTSDIEFEDDYLTLFLRHSKYSANKAFAQIQNYIRLKERYSKLFESVPDEYFSTIPSSKFGTVLPYRSPDGCTMVLCELGKWDPDEFSIDDFKRLGLLLFIQTLRDPMTQINGFKVIHDFKGTALKHLRHCTPHNLIFQYHAAINCIPGRYKEIHFVNESILLKSLWAIVRNFISKKMRNRVFFHSDPKDLLNHFLPSVLPEQYGGELADYYQEDLVRKLNEEYGKSPLGGEPNYF